MKPFTRKSILMLIVSLGMIAGLTTRSSTLFAEGDDIRIQYKVGEGTFIGNGDNLVHIQGRTQTRFTFTKLAGGAAATDSFSISRAEIRIDGHTLERKLKFGFEFKMDTSARATTATVCTGSSATVGACSGTASAVTAESVSGLAQLNDYYIDWVPTSYAGIQVGQFKVPFLIQQLTSETKQQFVDRPLATEFFNLRRDIGANIHGSVLNGKMNYAVFVMNGDGANSLNRNNRALMLGSRLEFPILGEYAYYESDLGYSDTQNLGVGVAYAFNEPASALQSNVAANTKAHNGTVDVGYKYKGFSFQGAGLLTRATEASMLTNWGYNAQVGYFLIPKTLEVAVREGGAVFSGAVANQYEHAGVVNYFVKGHGVKFQADYTVLRNTRGGAALFTNDHRVRAAMNLIF